jgi:hypothetical protein
MLDLGIDPLSLIFATTRVAFFAASEIGHRCGLRVRGEANISPLEAAMPGLVGALYGIAIVSIGFTG